VQLGFFCFGVVRFLRLPMCVWMLFSVSIEDWSLEYKPSSYFDPVEIEQLA
jgi:hypothetical protein